MPPKQKRQTRKDKLKSTLKDELKETKEDSDKVLTYLDSELKQVQKEKEKSTHVYWCKKEAYIKERIKLTLACKSFDASENSKERLRQLFVEFDLKKAIFLEYEREYEQEKANAEREKKEREKEEIKKKREKEREEKEKEEKDANDEIEKQNSSKGARPKVLRCKAYFDAKEELKAKKESEKTKKEIEVNLSVEEVFINAAKEYPGNTITAVRENHIYVANEKIYIFQNRDRNICMILVTLLLRIPHLISAILCQEAHYMYSTVFWNAFFTDMIAKVRQNCLNTFGDRLLYLAKEFESGLIVSPGSNDDTFNVRFLKEKKESTKTFFELVKHSSLLLREADACYKIAKISDKIFQVGKDHEQSIEETPSTAQMRTFLYEYTQTVPNNQLSAIYLKIFENTAFHLEGGVIFRIRF